MTPEDDQIRALLREVHRDDARSSPFQTFVRKQEPPRISRARVLVAIVVAGSGVAVLLSSRSAPPARDAFAWSSARWQGPLDFLLQLPNPRPLEALPGLESSELKGREQ